MSLTNFPPQTKVPGHVHKVKDHALEKDLTKMSKRELLDLISRQSALLENKFVLNDIQITMDFVINLLYLRSRLSSLPDKGDKIKNLYDRAVKALERKNEIDDASRLLTDLNLGERHLSDLEWKGKLKGIEEQNVLDSDDDEDPLAILTSSNTANLNRVIIKTSPDGRKSSLVTEDDINEAAEIVNSTLHFDPVLENICLNEKMDPSPRFLPHKPKFDDRAVLSSLSTSSDDNKKLRENTAASPPVQNHGAKLLSLRESIEIGHIQREKMKELQEKQAADRLALKAKEIIISNRQQGSMGRYRLKSSFSEHSDDDLKMDSSSDEAVDE